jgi:hypothetical protein
MGSPKVLLLMLSLLCLFTSSRAGPAKEEDELDKVSEAESPDDNPSAYTWYRQPNRVTFVHEQWYDAGNLTRALHTCANIHAAEKEQLAAVHPSPQILQALKVFCEAYWNTGADCINVMAPGRRIPTCSKRVFTAPAFEEAFNRTFIGYFPLSIPPAKKPATDMC